MPELVPGDPEQHAIRRDGVLVAWGSEGLALVLDPGLDFAPRVLVPDGGLFTASALEDRVWVQVVGTQDPGDEYVRRVREMTVDGEVTFPDIPTPGGRWPVAAVNQVLVLEGVEHDGFLVWDPRTDTVVDRLAADFDLASRGDVLAWCTEDKIGCDSAHIRDFATGEEKVLVCPPGTFGFEAFEGAFSPDGSTLALALRLDFGQDSRMALALIDVLAGELDVVDGTKVEPGYVFVDWSPSGESMFISGGSDERQVIEYRPADGEARTIPVELGDFYGMAAV